MRPRRENCWLVLFLAVPALNATCPIAFALPGDLNDDREISLPDVGTFVGCIEGPTSGPIDESCAAGDFDADGRIDLRDGAAFQSRFGYGVGPPRIDRYWPAPGEWIVDGVGLTHVEVGFSEPVFVPREAIVVWLVSRGIGNNPVEEFTHSYDADSDLLTITFDPPLRDDRVTLMLDYLIEDLSGRPLDGEILYTLNASLPSGDGHNGGQAVFRIHVLQGDASRDGVLDEADMAIVNASLGFCEGEAGFDSKADLDGDGCIDAADGNIVAAAVGRALPAVDGTPPRVIGVYADGSFGSFECLRILLSERIDTHKTNEHTCYLLDEDDNVITPVFAGSGIFGDVLDYFFEPPRAHCNLFRINLSNAIIDLSGELVMPQTPCTCLEDCPPYGESP